MAGQALARSGLICCLLFGPAAGSVHAAFPLPVFEQPGWAALTAEQRAVLAPLKEDWPTMDAFRRKKWIGIANRYADMSPAEQASIQRNMKEWARLSAEERKAAREQYKKLQKVAPEKRQAVKQKWEEYSALPQEERDRLRDAAPKRATAKPPASPPPNPRSPLSPIKPPQSPLVPKEGRPVPPSAPVPSPPPAPAPAP